MTKKKQRGLRKKGSRLTVEVRLVSTLSGEIVAMAKTLEAIDTRKLLAGDLGKLDRIIQTLKALAEVESINQVRAEELFQKMHEIWQQTGNQNENQQ
ncbi:MAG TPA: hypothetical protein VGF08_12550 [Terriglobales bacterium]|jgi:hypothetical protein